MNEDMRAQSPARTLDWLLTGLVTTTSGAERAVVLSADGLALAASAGMEREDAEHLAAMASALHSLARGVGTRFGKGALHQTVVELDHGYLLVTEAGFGACLALLAGADADLGLIAYEMNVIVGQVRDHLSASPRTSMSTRVP
ncbi:dynein regulation protein LC7 [Nocardia neocaledoniensis NBRC 108232]|uniref:Putative regulator of Ras-like GTPase activity (Roadblock/LC7/MglB family) n=1 Tax=Nocardia neocaledoniensis TaxID=236511 RepID=A0A317N0X7_9NOCA|nr:roadblock/LC7 domain-containing protein [Nocardia neocaledoniensis]PWV66952.1 putative regulator of Ras-like GTPase activity (Roadblock/LC7/MglB family) [Nocardia neocaledoniensis]GEM31311.1 dynein regulation protein LC7 [Nocardia neocaledoniensis NBRC 108232]